MGDSTSAAYNQKLSDSIGIEILGKIMVSIMMILFFITLLLLFLHLYFKCFTYPRSQYNIQPLNTRRNHFEFVSSNPVASHPLDPSVLSSIPVIIINSKHQEMECAVCLSETIDGERIRILPKCNHSFHVDCIDMWFHSNSTCPICRNMVSKQPEFKTETQNSAAFLTNVLVLGNQGEVTSLSSSSEEPSSSSSCASVSTSSSVRSDELVIDIPSQIDEDEETKSPIIKQWKSFKRLLSMGATRVSPSSSGPSGDDPGKMDTQ